MVWAGSVECPNCGSPVDTDASVCPYCYSSSPHSAAWQINSLGEWWWTYVPVFVGLAVFILAFASDTWFGTQWISQLLELIKTGD